jgi:hypothetical protein
VLDSEGVRGLRASLGALEPQTPSSTSSVSDEHDPRPGIITTLMMIITITKASPPPGNHDHVPVHGASHCHGHGAFRVKLDSVRLVVTDTVTVAVTVTCCGRAPPGRAPPGRAAAEAVSEAGFPTLSRLPIMLTGRLRGSHRDRRDSGGTVQALKNRRSRRRHRRC